MSSPVITDRQVVSRLLWKEFRQVRWLTLFVLCLGILAQGVCFFTLTPDGMGTSQSLPFSHVATLVAALFAIGCGATLFAGEHDNHTFLFQRILPASRRQVLGTKAGLMAGLTASLFLLFWLGALVFQGIAGGTDGFYFQSMLSGLFVCEMLVWSLYFSTVEKRPAYSICKALLGEMSVVILVNALVMVCIANPLTQEEWSAAIRLVVLIGLAIGTSRKMKFWYQGTEVSASRRSISGYLIRAIKFEAIHSSALGSLIWLQVRTAMGAMLMVGLAAIVLLILEGAGLLPLVSGRAWGYLLSYLGVLIGLLGMRGLMNHRNLIMQMGVRPVLAWISQLILPSLVLLTANLVILSGCVNLLFSASELEPANLLARDVFWLCSINGLALGSFCALLARPFLINLILAAIASTAVTFCMFSIQHWDASFMAGSFMTALIVASACAVSMRLVSGCLKVEQVGALGFWATADVRRGAWAVVLGSVACCCFPPVVRVYEVPFVSDQKVEQLLPKRSSIHASEQKAEFVSFLHRLQRISFVHFNVDDADLNYERVHQQVEQEKAALMEDKLSWLATLEPSVLQLRQQPYAEVDMPVRKELSRGFRSLIAQANKQGESDTGFNGLRLWVKSQRMFLDGTGHLIFDWASLPTTDSHAIMALLADLQAIDVMETMTWELENQYREAKANWDSGHGLAAHYSGNWPWEVSRERRLINTGLKRNVQNYQVLSECLRSGAPLREVSWEPYDYMLYQHIHPMYATNKGHEVYCQVRSLRATILRLAIIAWRKDHQGQLPSSLLDLKEEYLAEVPIDPFTGTDFVYFPKGIRLSGPTNPYAERFRFHRSPEQREANCTNPCLYVQAYYLPMEMMAEMTNQYHLENGTIVSEGTFYELLTEGGEKDVPELE